MKKILLMAALAGAAMMTACGNQGGIQMGSLSKLDSLSYAVGTDIAYSINAQMGDIPFDYKALTKGLQEGAFGKASETHEESIEKLRDYFLTKRAERAQAIYAQRAEQDSIRLAAGDSTKVDYPAADPAMFESEEERTAISYAFGNDIGSSLAQSTMPLQIAWITEAIQNVRDDNPLMPRDEAFSYLQYYSMVKMPAENAEASAAWLAKIEKKSGVKKTESGLLYKVTKAGDDNVKASDPRDEVKVQYTGRTRTGKVFDSSIFKNRPKEQQEMLKKQNPEGYDKDEPVEFSLNRVIKGWTEGLQLVGKGGKITLWIPADLAYGQRGAGRDIAPNEALEFEVEVIDVIPYEAPQPVAAEEEASEE